jgi:hypothetical protein
MDNVEPSLRIDGLVSILGMLEYLESHALGKKAWANIKFHHELEHLLFINFPHGIFLHAASIPFDLIWEVCPVNLKENSSNISKDQSYKLVKLNIEDSTNHPEFLLGHRNDVSMQWQHVLVDKSLQRLLRPLLVFELGYLDQRL